MVEFLYYFPFIFRELKMESEMVLSTKIAYNIAQHHFHLIVSCVDPYQYQDSGGTAYKDII